MVNESLTAELERYKERVAIFEQRQNVDLNKRDQLIDSQMDDLIRNRNAKFVTFQQEIDTLKETLPNNVKEKEYLSTTLSAFWLKHTNYNPDTSVKSHTPVRIEALSELPKVILVNESLKKLKYQLASFDKVVKKRTTSDAITADEITEVQTIFNQMEVAVDQCSVDKNAFKIQIKQLSIDNDQLLKQIMSQEIMYIAVISVDILNVNKSCVDECNKCLELETELLKKNDLIEKDSQEKDTVIRKLKDRIKSLIGKDSVEKLRKEREHLKSIYKVQFDSIRKARVQSKEHCDSLIAQINAKSVENSDLNAQLQEKVFAIVALKNELRKLKGKDNVDTAVSKPSTTIAP
ncbi:hypothetical protein Tco_0810192 [Tanacetum coccineum]